MRLAEFADAQAQLELWQLISDKVWSTLNAEAPQPVRPAPQQPRVMPQSPPVIKPKRRVARPVKIPQSPPPKPLAQPKPLYPGKPPTPKPKAAWAGTPRKGQAVQSRVKTTPSSSPAANPNMATRGIAKMNAPIENSKLRKKPAQP